jgi:hypothetical protein
MNPTLSKEEIKAKYKMNIIFQYAKNIVKDTNTLRILSRTQG